MSKLADRIRKVSKVEPAPLGFAAAAARRTAPTLLCLVRLSQGDAGRVEEAAKKGADAVILDGVDPARLKEPKAKAGEAVLGIGAAGAERERIAALRDAGAEFAVFDLASAMADALLEEKIGIVLSIDGDCDDTTLRLLGDLGPEALVVTSPDGPLTIRDLLKLRRVAALARTPLLTSVRPDAAPGHLQALRESGVAGVIVDSAAIGKLEGLRERIAALPPRGKRAEEKAEAVLPAASMSPTSEDEDDE